MRSITRVVALLAYACVAESAPNVADVPGHNLESVAQVATVMMDGDVCSHIQTARSAEYALKKDPRDPWRASDNYDINSVPFIQTKKTLIRLARLCASACDVNLWMPVPSRPDRIQIVIRNVHELSQFWTWGQMDQDMPPEMARVLSNQKPVTVSRKPGMTSVLSPVYDSLGNAVALVEVVTERNPDPRENVK